MYNIIFNNLTPLFWTKFKNCLSGLNQYFGESYMYQSWFWVGQNISLMSCRFSLWIPVTSALRCTVPPWWAWIATNTRRPIASVSSSGLSCTRFRIRLQWKSGTRSRSGLSQEIVDLHSESLLDSPMWEATTCQCQRSGINCARSMRALSSQQPRILNNLCAFVWCLWQKKLQIHEANGTRLHCELPRLNSRGPKKGPKNNSLNRIQAYFPGPPKNRYFFWKSCEKNLLDNSRSLAPKAPYLKANFAEGEILPQ